MTTKMRETPEQGCQADLNNLSIEYPWIMGPLSSPAIWKDFKNRVK